MFYDEKQAIAACEEEPSLIFELIKEGHLELVDKLLKERKISVAEIDEEGNTVLMKLLKLKQYDMVLKYMNYSDFEVNHQNIEGNTFAHILVTKSYISIAPIIKKLRRNKEFMPNIKNNNGETILDLATKSDNLCTAFKILADKRFNNIDVMSFLSFYKKFIKSSNYGKYMKLSNLEVVVENLEKKNELLPWMERLVSMIHDDFDLIKKEIMCDKLTSMDSIINMVLVEASA